MNPRCPPARAPTEAITTEAEQSKMVENAKEPERSAPAKDFAGTSYVLPSLFFFFVTSRIWLPELICIFLTLLAYL